MPICKVIWGLCLCACVTVSAHAEVKDWTRFEQDDVHVLLKNMMVWAGEHTRFGLLPDVPQVVQVHPEALAGGVCRVCPVARAYSVKRIAVAYHLDVLRNRLDESYLFHELVHVLQMKSGTKDPKHNHGASSCEDERQNEFEAYHLQLLYYRNHGGFAMPFAIPHLMCSEDETLMLYPDQL
jgi:hypothetical protein